MKRKSYPSLLIIGSIGIFLLGAVAVSYLNGTDDNESVDTSIPMNIDEINTILSKEPAISYITPSPDQAMVAYVKKSDSNKYYESYLWRVGEHYPIGISKLTSNISGIFWNSISSNFFICTKIENKIVSKLIWVNALHKNDSVLESTAIPLWSPDGEMFALVLNKEYVVSLAVYNNNLELNTLIAESNDLNVEYILHKWNSNNTIDYSVVNLKEKSEINRSYALTRTIYSIVGESNKLSKRIKGSINKWRNEAVVQARYNANDMFINGNSDEKIISLTFDDGPDDINTLKILEILKKYKVKGSFFIVGSKAEKYPEVVKRIKAEGHLVLNHSYSHANFQHLTTEQITKEILQAQSIIKGIIGSKPLLMRTPYGIVNDRVLKVLRKLNSKNILWSLDSLDWSGNASANIINNTLNNARAGDIMLFHGHKYSTETVTALPTIIEKLTEQGYQLVDVAELLGIDAYE